MSVEFRQRTPGEYARIVWKRKFLIILPALAIASAVAIVVWKLPDVYQSTTLLVVKPPDISKNLVPMLSDDAVSSRISSIGQIVTSRSKLEPLILKYDLYHLERAGGASMENAVNLMRARDIAVELDRGGNGNVPAFRISYKERNPKITQAVTGDLASMYVSANTTDAANAGASAKQFFQQQIEQAKNELDEVDRLRIAYMTAHQDTSPSGGPGLVGQLAGLRDQQRTLTTEIGRRNDTLNAMNTQLSELQSQSKEDRGEIIDQVTDPKGTPAYGQLLQTKSALEAELQDMLTTLKPQNPDVKRQEAKISSVKRNMDNLVAENQTKMDALRKKLQDKKDPRIDNYKLQIDLNNKELARQRKLLDDVGGQISEIESRLNAVPGTEVGLQALSSEYQSKKIAYESLLDRKRTIDMASEATTTQQGETIQVIDPASYPQKPIAPKRPMLIALGLAFGLAIGFALAALFEVPRLLTIQTTEDAAHYTGLPVLASVPELLTAKEARRIPQRRLLLLAAGIAITILSIPALALALRATHIFDRFVS